MVLSGRYHNSWSFLSANPRDSVATSAKILSWPMQRLMIWVYRPNPQGRDPAHDGTQSFI